VALDFLEYREASSKLIGEGLVSETNEGQLYLTPAGFRYCRERHAELQGSEFFPHEELDQEKLRQALASD
jgi:hypothetical protein